MTARRLYSEVYNAIMNLFIYFAAAILIQKFLLFNLEPWMGVLYCSPCFLVYFAGRALYGKKLFFALPIGVIVSIGLSLIPILLSWELSIFTIIAYVLIPVFTLVLFFMPYISGPNMIGSARFVSGLVLFMAGIFFGGAHASSYNTFLNTAAIIFLISGLFTFNRENLRDATKPAKTSAQVKFPPGMRRNNIIMLILIIIIGLFIANIEKLRVLAADALVYMIYLFVQFMLWLGKMMGMGGGSGEPGSGGGQPNMGGEAHALNPLVEKIIQVVTIAIVVAVVLVVLFLIIKAVKKLLTDMPDWLKRLLNRLSSEGDQSYIDETEDLLDKGGLKKEIAQNFANLWDKITYRAPKFEDMPDNRAKVRFVFKHLLKRISIKKRNALTNTPIELTDDANKVARENTADFIDAYNRARYGPNDVSDEAAAIAKKLLKKL